MVLFRYARVLPKKLKLLFYSSASDLHPREFNSRLFRSKCSKV